MESEVLSGTVAKVFPRANPDGPWMAGVLDIEGKPSIKFNGKVFAKLDDRLEIEGKWDTHPTFGLQFIVTSGVVKMNDSPEALEKLLATHKDFTGLGPVRAKKVVEAAELYYPDDLHYALVNGAEFISVNSGVSLAIIQNAAKVWGNDKAYFDALAQLCQQGWSGAQATRIVNEFGNNAPAMVDHDPYFLIGKLERFGFRTVDAVARKMGVSSTNPHRLASGILFCLDRIANDGNTWTTKVGLFQVSMEELQPDTLEAEELTMGVMNSLIEKGLIVEHRTKQGESIIADAKLCWKEIKVFEMLIESLKAPVPSLRFPCKEMSTQHDLPSGIISTLNPGQLSALNGISRSRFGVISGGAGVGKTYLMKAICDLAEAEGLHVTLCAPTGRAARKLEHSTERQAKTIHRTLESFFEGGGFRFRRNADYQLETDLVILDEFSMVDIHLMYSLLVALPPTARLILVGDHNQIPSVGPGAILRDLLFGKDFYPYAVHLLTMIVRQAGILARNVTAILDGIVCPEPSPSWMIYPTEPGHKDMIPGIIADIVEDKLTQPEPDPHFGRKLSADWDIQVLSPMRKGGAGIWALNTELQRMYQRLMGNQPPAETEEGKAPKPLVGDRIMWTKNDYVLDLFNGTQALVTEICTEGENKGCMWLFTEDGRNILISSTKRIFVEVAWAITIHKSQGSEWPMVILVGSSSHWNMHDRNLFYTGGSRASEALAIVGDKTGMRHFAKQEKSARRQTFGDLIVRGWHPGDAATTGSAALV